MLSNITTQDEKEYFDTQMTMFAFKAGTVCKVGGGFSVLCGIAAAVFAILSEFFLIGFLAFAALLLGVLLLCMPMLSKKNCVMKFAKLSKDGKSVKFVFEFYDDEFFVTIDGNEQKFAYVLLTGVYETEKYYFLMTDNAFGLTVDKNCFNKGSADDLKEILVGHKIHIVNKVKQ